MSTKWKQEWKNYYCYILQKDKQRQHHQLPKETVSRWGEQAFRDVVRNGADMKIVISSS